MVNRLHFSSTFTVARPFSSDPPLWCSLRRAGRMPRLSWLCRCAEVPGRSQNPLVRSCQRCAIRCSAPAVHDVSILHRPLSLVFYSSSWYRCVMISFFFTFLAHHTSNILAIYSCICLVFFVSSSVWFCFPARSSGELCVWLKCVDWCCCGATPFSSSPLLISSMVAAACETRSTRILCLKVSHSGEVNPDFLFIFIFLESPAMMTSIMCQY